MKEAEVIAHTYQLISMALTDKLGALGYVISEQEENDRLFGSRYVIWSNNADAVRFTWDGKENVFLVEVTDNLPISSSAEWTSIGITTFNPLYENDTYISKVVEKVITSMN